LSGFLLPPIVCALMLFEHWNCFTPFPPNFCRGRVTLKVHLKGRFDFIRNTNLLSDLSSFGEYEPEFFSDIMHPYGLPPPLWSFVYVTPTRAGFCRFSPNFWLPPPTAFLCYPRTISRFLGKGFPFLISTFTSSFFDLPLLDCPCLGFPQSSNPVGETDTAGRTNPFFPR